MKLRLTTILASAAVIFASVIAAVGTASPAHAEEETFYAAACLDYPYTSVQYCALADGPGNELQIVQLHTSYTTNWWQPLGGLGNGSGFFQQADTDLCMQVDHNAGNVVIEAKCATAESYQLWTPVYSTDAYGTYIARYETNWNKSLCLSYVADGQTFTVTSCGNYWYQWFLTPDNVWGV
jgi:hypothetical protein